VKVYGSQHYSGTAAATAGPTSRPVYIGIFNQLAQELHGSGRAVLAVAADAAGHTVYLQQRLKTATEQQHGMFAVVRQFRCNTL